MKRNEDQCTLEWTKQLLDWDNATVPAKEWWQELEALNDGRVDLVLKLAGELLERAATIDDFFLACSYSGREGVQENLRFLDTICQDKKYYRADTPKESPEAIDVERDTKNLH